MNVECEKKVRRQHRWQTTMAVGLTMSSVAPTVHAMPYYKKDRATVTIDASRVLSDPVLRGTSIFVDHLPEKKVLYVSPSSKKAQAGLFQISATPACEILANQYELTYAVPDKYDTDSWHSSALAGPYSAYFDSHYGNYIRHTAVLEALTNTVAELEVKRQSHPEVVKEYETARIKVESAKAHVATAAAAFNETPKRLDDLMRQLSIATETTLPVIREEILSLRAAFQADAPALRAALREATAIQVRAENELAATKGAYLAVMPEEATQTSRIAALASTFATIQSLATTTYQLSSITLLKLETASVGYSTASYSIWGDEEARLRNIVQQSGSDYAVARLPIFNVTVKPTQGHTDPNSAPALLPITSFTPALNNAVSVSIEGTNASVVAVSDGEQPANPVFRDSSGAAIMPLDKTLSGNGAGSFRNLVTRGAYCTGASDRRVHQLTITSNINSRPNLFNVALGVYTPRASNVLAQSVAMEYDYNLKSDPISVHCEMNISRFRSFVSSRGSSGFLFWRKKWSNEERKSVEQSGISCKVDNNEVVSDGISETNDDRLQKLQQDMMAEIGAEFVLTYAKSYELIKNQAAEVSEGKAVNRFGVAMQTLCGTNVYCQVGAVILKDGNELFGSNRGSASGSDSINGSITRDYSEWSYRKVHSQATVDLSVSL